MSARSGRPRGVASALLGMLGVAVVAGLMITVGVAPAIALTGVGAKNGIGLFENLPEDLKIAQLAAEDRDLRELRRQGRAHRVLLQPEPRGHPVVGRADDGEGRHAGGRGRAVLHARRGRPHGHRPRAGLGHRRRRPAGRVDHHAAVREERAASRRPRLLSTQAAVDAAYADCTGGIGRKLKEARLAIGLEKKYSKNDILLGYLNIAGFGGQIYGIEAAAQYYFHTHAKDLTNAQAASLMAIVNAPNDLKIDDKANLEANTTRRDYILDTELKHNLISQADHDAAIKTPVKPRITPTADRLRAGRRGRLLLQLRASSIVEQNPAFGATQGQRLNNLQSAGWKIYTTLDLDLEKKAKATMSRYVPAKSPSGTDLGGAAVTVQVGTGKILSMVAEQDLQREPKATQGRRLHGDGRQLQRRPRLRRLDVRLPARIDLQALHAARLVQERPRRLRDRQRQRPHPACRRPQGLRASPRPPGRSATTPPARAACRPSTARPPKS